MSWRNRTALYPDRAAWLGPSRQPSAAPAPCWLKFSPHAMAEALAKSSQVGLGCQCGLGGKGAMG